MSIKKNNAYYEENGKIYYYDDAGVREAVPDSAFGDLGEMLDNLYSNSDCVYVDPENGDDTKDGLTRNTAVKYLKRAAEIYVEQFGGKNVKAHVINTHCPENYQDSETWIDPGNSTNLFLDEIDFVDEVMIINDGGICLSDQDNQTVPGQISGSAYPKYKLNVVSERSIGLYININPFQNTIKAVSNTGDIHINGTYLQDLKCIKLVCQNGSLYSAFGPRFNSMLDVDAEFYFDAKYYFANGTFVSGKNATVISRNTEKTGYNPSSGKNINVFPVFFLNKDLTILSSGSIRETNSGHPTSFIGGKLTVRSLGSDTGSLCLWDIQGHCSDGSGWIVPGDPSINSYPDIDIDWDGDVYFGYYVNTLSNTRSRTIANSVKIKCNKLAFFAGDCDIFSRSDIVLDLKDGDMNSLSYDGVHLYADGFVRITSENALKCGQNIHADNVEIIAGGIAEHKAATRNTGSGSRTDKNRTATGNINARIDNAIEFFVGNGQSYTTSNRAAVYSVKCTGDYCDSRSSFQNGNATVTLDVAGSATISYEGSMYAKRFVLRSDHAYITNSGINACGFDIKCSKIQVQNGGYLRQWFSYGNGGWIIGYKEGSSVTNGASWSHSEEDLSIVSCDSLEFLNSSFYDGWIRPAYTSDSEGNILKHDWEVHVGTLIPWRRRDGYYTSGTELCALFGQPFQGTPNSSITGTIGDVMIGDGQFISEFKHDWFMSTNNMSYYEQYDWNGCTISCHFLKEISHNIYIDFTQGNDAYDGLSRETPVRTMYGLNRACNNFVSDPRSNYVLTIHVMSSGSGSYDNTSASWGPYNCLDFNSNLDRNSTNQGILYNWYAAKYLDDNRATLLPEGWRVPTSDDFNKLQNNGGSACVDLKSKYWCGNDKYGLNFTKCGTGYSTYFNTIYEQMYIWSSEESNGNGRYLNLYKSGAYTSTTAKYAFYPVRLVKTADSSAQTGDTGSVTIGGNTYSTVVIGGLEWITQNLDYKFSGATFRDGTSGNTINGSSTPQCAYYQYGSDGYYSVPFGYCQYIEIVSEKPFLSVFVQGLNAGVCKITGFRNVHILDPRISCLYLDASEDINYTCGYNGKYGHDQPDEYYPNVLVSKSRNFYGAGFHSASSTYIEASENFRCKSSNSTAGSSATPYFSGSIGIHSKNIEIGDQCALFQQMNAVLEADYRITFYSPPTVKNGSLKLISHCVADTGINNLYLQRIYCASIAIEAPTANVYVAYLHYDGDSGNGTTNPGGTFSVNCNSFTSNQKIYNSDVFIHAQKGITFTGCIYGDSSSRVELTGHYIYSPTVYGGTYSINCTDLETPILIGYGPTSGRTGTTTVFANIDSTRHTTSVFQINGLRTTDYELEARIRDLATPFIVSNIGTLPYNGQYVKKCKGVVEFYTGSYPDTDLQDWRDTVASEADFELIVLNRAKQLVAGNGISISDTGDNVVIASETRMVEIPVVVDALDDTQCSATLVLNKYNVITGLDEYVTDMDIIIPSTGQNVLREVGFEFAPVSGNSLSAVNFFGEGGIPLFEITPEEYYYGCMYQGAAVNRCVTLVEYGEPVEPEPEETVVIDGRSYKIVTMPDGSVWMAENLADDSFGGVCLNDGTDDSYGLFYTETELHNISVPGWHIPTSTEVQSLISSVNAVSELTSTTEWTYTNGTDDYGINFKPYGGCQFMDSEWSWIPLGGVFVIWIAPENGDDWQFGIFDWDGSGYHYSTMPALANSYKVPVRLVKDAE